MQPLIRWLRTITPAEWIATITLGLASAFAAALASQVLLLNPDAIVNVFLFQKGPLLGDIFIADWHTNLLKVPVMWLQGHIPFTPKTFAGVNAVLIMSTLGGWAAAASLAFGRKYYAPFAFTMAILAAATVVLPGEIGFTTTRNFEYPLFLLLLILFWKLVPLLSQKSIARRTWWLCALYTTVMTVLLMNDPFFAYVGIPALLLVFGLPAWKNKQLYSRQSVWLAVGLALIPYVVAKVTLLGMLHLHVFQYYGESFSPPLNSIANLPSVVWGTVSDLAVMFNGEIFDRRVEPVNYNRIVMLAVGIASAIAYIKAVKKLPQTIAKQPLLASLLITTLCSYLTYILLAGFVHQYRYIVLLLLVMVTMLVLWAYPYAQQLAIKPWQWVTGACLTTILMATLCIFQYIDRDFYNFPPQKAAMANLAYELQKRQINTVMAGHTYASVINFWSGSKLAMVPLLYCNQNMPFLTRESWYHTTPQTSEHVALVVDRTGRDQNSWQCSDNLLFEYYGRPLDHFRARGLGGSTLDVYIMPKDIINKVQVIKHKGRPEPILSQ